MKDKNFWQALKTIQPFFTAPMMPLTKSIPCTKGFARISFTTCQICCMCIGLGKVCHA